MRTISALPPELTRLLFDAGNRIIVLVEGEDDRDVLREWFSEQRPEIEFYDCGGSAHLEPLLNELLKHSTLKRAYAISDRDFRNEAEVEASYAEDSHLFILRRYAFENYLLEPQPLWQIFKIQDPSKFADEQAIGRRLLELCRKLKSVMAVNWLFWDENRTAYTNSGITKRLEYLSLGFEPERTVVLQAAAQRLKETETAADIRLAAKEDLIEQQLIELTKAHTVIDGKRLLHWLQREDFGRGPEVLRRWLIREGKLAGVQADLCALVLDRILKENGK